MSEFPTYYTPSAGDLAYSKASKRSEGINPFEEAMLLRKVSDTYLSVLISDNTSSRSVGFRAMIEAELTRRAGATARQANAIAIFAAGAALASAIIAVFAIFQ